MIFKFWVIITVAGLIFGNTTPPADSMFAAMGDLCAKTGDSLYRAARLPLSPLPTGHTYDDIMSPPPLSWTPRRVVMERGALEEADAAGVESPVVIRETDGAYTMWYKGLDKDHDYWRILRAVSPDGLHWTKTGVVMEPTEPCEGDKLDPMAVLLEDGVYRMWYGGGAGGGNACYAVSADGINWAKYAGNPVLEATSGSWDNWGAGGQHTVIRTGDTYRMIYKGYGDSDRGWAFYGLATSTDGKTWEKQGKLISPEPALGEAANYRNIGSFRVGGHYCLLHTSSDHLSLFLLSSRDGEHWQKCGIIFARNENIDASDTKWTTSPSLISENDMVKIWYEGADSSGRVRIHYAEVGREYFTERCYDIITTTSGAE